MLFSSRTYLQSFIIPPCLIEEANRGPKTTHFPVGKSHPAFQISLFCSFLLVKEGWTFVFYFHLGKDISEEIWIFHKILSCPTPNLS